jgi:hypothetical protein
MGASLSAKLARLPAKQFRSAIRSIERMLQKDPGATERQTPEQTRVLILDWAAQAGLKVERHERPVI